MGRKRGQRKGQIYFLRAMDLDDGPLLGHCGLWLFGFPQGRRPIGLHAHLCKHQCACVHILLAHLCMCVCTCTHQHARAVGELVIISLKVSNSISHHIEVGLKN